MRTLLLAVGAYSVAALNAHLVTAQSLPNDMLLPLAASIREEITRGPVAFDPRLICPHSSPSCTSSSAEHSAPSAVAFANLLSARVVPADSVRLCQDASRMCMAAALVAVSAAKIRGDSAIVVARLWFDGARNDLPRSVWREVEFVLYRAQAGWRVVRKGIVGAS